MDHQSSSIFLNTTMKDLIISDIVDLYLSVLKTHLSSHNLASYYPLSIIIIENIPTTSTFK